MNDRSFQPSRADLWSTDENQPFNSNMLEWIVRSIFSQLDPTHMKTANNAIDDRLAQLLPTKDATFAQMAMYLPSLKDLMQITQPDRLAMFHACIKNMPWASLKTLKNDCIMLYKSVMFTIRNAKNNTGHKLKNHDALANLLSQSVNIFDNQVHLDKLAEDMGLLCLQGPNVDTIMQMEVHGANIEAHPQPGPDHNRLLPFRMINWSDLVTFLAHAGLPEHAEYLHPSKVIDTFYLLIVLGFLALFRVRYLLSFG